MLPHLCDNGSRLSQNFIGGHTQKGTSAVGFLLGVFYIFAPIQPSKN